MDAVILALTLLSAVPSTTRQPANVPDQHVSISIGASIQEVIAAYGTPEQVHEEDSFLQLVYMNDVCAASSCSVIVQEGVVTKFVGVKPSLISL